MGTDIKLTANDGHELGGYLADPPGEARGALVVLQEIFGVNAHIRDVCERFAADGYVTLAPALYDRSSRHNCQLGYSPEDVELGRKLREEFSWDDTVQDIDAAIESARRDAGKVGCVGYCWGGTMAFLAATRLELEAAVVYYGGQIMPYLEESEKCPLLMHFGRRDQAIPLTDVDRIAAAHPEAMVHLYDADHGFNCDRRGSYDPDAAALARERTLRFFQAHL